jgi:hypothetical protein
MPIDVTSLVQQTTQKLTSATSALTSSLPSLSSAVNTLSTKLPSGASITAMITGGLSTAQNQPFTAGAARDILSTDNAPSGVPTPKVNAKIPQLLQNDVRALMLQIAHMETKNDHTFLSSEKVGRYAVHNKTLINYGYLDKGGATYTGKDGIQSASDFIYDTNVQDRIMERYILDQYKALIKVGAIKENDKKEVVAGMIAVSYKFQAAAPGASSAKDSLGLLNTGDTSSLVNSSASLATSLSETLKSASGASASTVQSAFDSSGLKSAAENIVSANPAGSLDPSKIQGSAVASKAQSLTATAATAVDSVKKALLPEANNLQAQLKKVAAQVDINKLKSSASDLATSIPANAAKDWRNNGTGGAETYFNAGKYAIVSLGADVKVTPDVY